MRKVYISVYRFLMDILVIWSGGCYCDLIKKKKHKCCLKVAHDNLPFYIMQ